MSTVFLGKWWHWALLVVVLAGLGVAGSQRLHVINFNTFILCLLGGVGAILALLVYTQKPGELVTRDEIDDSVDDSPTDKAAG